MTLQLDEDLAQFLQSGEQSAEDAARELIVLELYRRHRISGGKAAELLRMDRLDFIQRASDLGIPYLDMSAADWEQEVAAVEALTVDHRR